MVTFQATMRRDGWPRLSEPGGVLIAGAHVWLLLIPSANQPTSQLILGSPFIADS